MVKRDKIQKLSKALKFLIFEKHSFHTFAYGSGKAPILTKW